MKNSPIVPEQQIPTTRLELRWKRLDAPDADGYTWLCEYNLILGFDELDIRGEVVDEEGILCFRSAAKVLSLGGTKTTGNGDFVRNGEIRTPFRDGAHIQWDSKRLGDLPMFVIYEGKAQQILRKEERDEP